MVVDKNLLRSGSSICYDALASNHSQEPRAMATIPAPATELLEAALVAELTVVDPTGRPVTYPLIPLWDGERVYMPPTRITSSMSPGLSPESLSAALTGPSVFDTRSATRSSSLARDRVTTRCFGPDASAVM